VKNRKSGDLEMATMNISTTGGECRKIVATCLSKFFGQIGLPQDFKWGTDFASTPLLQDIIQEEEREAERERKAKAAEH